LAEVLFVIDPIAFREEFQTWEGTLGRYMTAKTEEVRVAAVAEAPGPGKPPRNRTGFNYGTGRLESSIKVDHGFHHGATGQRELEGTVKATAPHALMVHGGTRAHVIRPRTPGGILRFRVHTGGVVFARSVNHPGTLPNDYMVRALKRTI